MKISRQSWQLSARPRKLLMHNQWQGDKNRRRCLYQDRHAKFRCEDCSHEWNLAMVRQPQNVRNAGTITFTEHDKRILQWKQEIKENDSMKICIPTETNKENQRRCMVILEAHLFHHLWCQERYIEIIDNANQHHEHGMCSFKCTGRQNCGCCGCRRHGARAVMKLNEGGIKTYRAIAGSVEEVIKRFKDGTLEEITIENACASHGCH